MPQLPSLSSLFLLDRHDAWDGSNYLVTMREKPKSSVSHGPGVIAPFASASRHLSLELREAGEILYLSHH